MYRLVGGEGEPIYLGDPYHLVRYPREVQSHALRPYSREQLDDAEGHSGSLHTVAFPPFPTCSTMVFSTRPYFLSLFRVL